MADRQRQFQTSGKNSGQVILVVGHKWCGVGVDGGMQAGLLV